MQPSALQPSPVNNLTINQERLERDLKEHLQKISEIDQQRRSTIEIAQKVTSSQIEILQDFLSKANHQKDYQELRQKLKDKCIQIAEMQINDYEKSLNTSKEKFTINGNDVYLLTTEKKQELVQVFRKVVEKQLAENDVDVDPPIDVQSLVLKLEKKNSVFLTVSSTLLKNQSSLSDEASIFTQHITHLAEEKKRYFEKKTQDIWQAAERGDIVFLEAECKNRTTIFKKLTKKTATFNFLDQFNDAGSTLLHIAASSQQEEFLIKLLENGANVDVFDREGYHPLHRACQVGNIRIADYISKYSKLPNLINLKGGYSRTPLHMAVFNLKTPMVIRLLLNQADVNAQTDFEDSQLTPLHLATERQDFQQVKILTSEKNLNVNLKNGKGLTALYCAVYDGSADIAALILSHASWKNPEDVNDRNHLKKLLEIVPKKNQKEIRFLLENFNFSPSVTSSKPEQNVSPRLLKQQDSTTSMKISISSNSILPKPTESQKSEKSDIASPKISNNNNSNLSALEEQELEKSISAILSQIDLSKKAIEAMQGKEVTILLGETGGGKSSTLNYLAGCTIREVRGKLETENLKAPIGQGRQSETFLMHAYALQNSPILLCDLPAFSTTRGTEINIANAVCTHQLLAQTKSNRYLLVEEYQSLTTAHGKSFKSDIKNLGKLLKKENLSSLIIAINRVPIDIDSFNDVRDLVIELAGKEGVDLEKYYSQIIQIDPLEKTTAPSREEILQMLNQLPSEKPQENRCLTYSEEDLFMISKLTKMILKKAQGYYLDGNFKGIVKEYERLNSLLCLKHPSISEALQDFRHAIRNYLEQLELNLRLNTALNSPDAKFLMEKFEACCILDACFEAEEQQMVTKKFKALQSLGK